MANKKEDPKSAEKSNSKGAGERRKLKVKRVEKKKDVLKRTIWSMVYPYLLMILSIVLSAFFFIDRLFPNANGVGVVGRAVQQGLCGLFGVAALMLPVMFFYIGLKWCLFNIKCSRMCEKNEKERSELLETRRFAIIQTITSLLLVFFVSILIAVIFDKREGFVVSAVWTASLKDLAGGGIVGGFLGFLFNKWFGKVTSIIFIALLLTLDFVFMAGFTPDRVVMMIQSRREKNKQKRAEEAQRALREAAEQESEERKHRNRMIVTDNAPSDLAETDRANEAKCGAQDLEPIILDIDGVSRAEENAAAVVVEKAASENVGGDFGGDPAFDTNEFEGIQTLLNSLGVSSAAAVNNEDDDEIIAEEPEEEEEGDLDEIDQLRQKETETLNLVEMKKEELMSDVAAVAPEEGEQDVEIITPYVFPPVDMLARNPQATIEDYTAELQENAQILKETLSDFKINIKDITYSRGPTITRYELRPESGTRVRAIANLVDDIALNLATSGVRIEAPIPNKPAVGIEVPNRTRATVYLRDLIDSPKFFEAKSRLTACLGMDVGGNPIYFDVSKMPHLLIAGATGMGKSVCINTIIVSMLYKAKPDELKLILIDPKKVEFAIYKNIPHLYAPIVSDPKKAAGALASAVAEMERRFELIEEVGVRDIAGYNAATENDPDKEFMPQMVIIIDELADLMMTAAKEVETSICRLAQKARAAGIHIIIGTQRPSVDVITGLIKANIPSRIACTVASQTDSRTILDIAGAEKLIGRGDMLFAPVGASKPMRVQGAFVSDSEVESIVTYIRDNNAAGKFNAEFIDRLESEAANVGMSKKGAQGGPMDSMSEGANDGGDSKFDQAVILAIEEGKISTSLMQRRLGVGYGRAAKIIDEMEERGYVSKPDGNKPRRVLVSMEEYQRRKIEGDVYGDVDE